MLKILPAHDVVAGDRVTISVSSRIRWQAGVVDFRGLEHHSPHGSVSHVHTEHIGPAPTGLGTGSSKTVGSTAREIVVGKCPFTVGDENAPIKPLVRPYATQGRVPGVVETTSGRNNVVEQVVVGRSSRSLVVVLFGATGLQVVTVKGAATKPTKSICFVRSSELY